MEKQKPRAGIWLAGCVSTRAPASHGRVCKGRVEGDEVWEVTTGQSMKPELLKPQCTHTSPEDLVKMQTLIQKVWGRPKVCLSNVLPGDALVTAWSSDHTLWVARTQAFLTTVRILPLLWGNKKPWRFLSRREVGSDVLLGRNSGSSVENEANKMSEASRRWWESTRWEGTVPE